MELEMKCRPQLQTLATQGEESTMGATSMTGEGQVDGAEAGAPMSMEWEGKVGATRPMEWSKTSERTRVPEG